LCGLIHVNCRYCSHHRSRLCKCTPSWERSNSISSGSLSWRRDPQFLLRRRFSSCQGNTSVSVLMQTQCWPRVLADLTLENLTFLLYKEYLCVWYDSHNKK